MNLVSEFQGTKLIWFSDIWRECQIIVCQNQATAVLIALVNTSPNTDSVDSVPFDKNVKRVEKSFNQIYSVHYQALHWGQCYVKC